MWSPRQGWREEIWSRLDQSWDLIVIGGGITGAGILAEAARLGKKTLLLEARDFSSGTSSRSTKLVHGGLRYLRQGQVKVTRESVIERERLLREAKGLVTPLGFYLTTFQNDSMPGWMFGAGLAVYDLIARKWAHEKFGMEELLERVPSLTGAPVKGGYHYYDAQTDDSRLTVRVLREAVRRGGTALNYARVTALLRTEDGRVRGVTIRDEVTGRTAEIEAPIVINATGVWADDLRERVGATRKLRAIRGSHLIFPRGRLPIDEAVSLLHPRDGRAVFAVPWEGVILFGTTDVDHGTDLETEPSITSSEVEYLLEAAVHAFPAAALSHADVRSTWAGVRGVINTGASNPAKESREHVLWNEDGLLTVTGGKLTTFRMMALETLRAVGLKGKREHILDNIDEVELDERMNAESRGRLLGRYGTEAPEVLASMNGLGAEKISDVPPLWCELRWAARSEGVVHLDDLLLRRVRLGLLLDDGGMPLMPQIRSIVQPELGWDDATWTTEEARYREVWLGAYGVTPRS
jgi:glycerol-3-phosphate dehydrogenase